MPARRPALLAAAVGILSSGVVTLVMLWPALGSGYLLYRDFITVPDPALSPRTWGMTGSAPRAVPLDGVMAVLDPVVPTWLQQKLILLGCLWLGGSGIAVLLRHRGTVAAALGGIVGTWSPFATERLLLGQAPTLLAWSMLPWLVMASRRSGRARSRVVLVTLAALPAALTPSGGLTAAAAAVVLSVLARRRRRETLAVIGLGLIWCLPWLVPAVGGRSGAGVAEGAAAFRVDAPGLSGVLDVLGGGGVWADGAGLASRDHPVAGAATVVLLLLASVGLSAFSRPHRRLLGLALLLPPVVVLVLASPFGLAAFAAAQSVPGVALFRDTHRLLALSSFVLAVLAPVGVVRVVQRLGQHGSGGPRAFRLTVSASAACAGAAVVILAAPDAPPRLHGAYHPVDFPSDWGRVVALVADESTLVLPWQPMRRTPWNAERPFLDPLPLALPGDVIAATDLVVERDGQRFNVGSGDPSRTAGWLEGRLDLAELDTLGVKVVVEWRQSPGRPVSAEALETLQLISETTTFRVWRVR